MISKSQHRDLVMRMLASGCRLTILEYLLKSEKEMCSFSEIYEYVMTWYGDVAMPTVSSHLADLYRCRMLERAQDGKYTSYSIRVEWRDALRDWFKALGRLERLAREH
jgi:DNA-binding transcriptional ArsR family regulator